MSSNLSVPVCTFYLNERRTEVFVRPDETALELLRDRLKLTGTKESCSEGDCGACTIAIGEWVADRFQYRAVNSCLFPAPRLHGKHVITIEGLADGELLHPIQTAILENHATQCGYCTPGIVMSLFCWLLDLQAGIDVGLTDVLEGNLCRCTGYISILQAGLALKQLLETHPKNKYLPAYCYPVQESLRTEQNRGYSTKPSTLSELRKTRSYLRPASCDELMELLQKLGETEYRFLNGATDIGVEQNVQRHYTGVLIDLSDIPELKQISVEAKTLKLGGAVTFRAIIDSADIRQNFPVLQTAAQWLGSHQIRNVATLTGNIARASPIADGTVAALALGAELEIISPRGKRTVLLDSFFLDYRKTILTKDEVILVVRFPISTAIGSFIKSSKRVAVDIASVNSCCVMSIEEGVVLQCRIAVGGIDKIPTLAKRAASFLIGKSLSSQVITECAKIAASEFNPISDIRGSDWFRNQLLKNQIVAHLTQHIEFASEKE